MADGASGASPGTGGVIVEVVTKNSLGAIRGADSSGYPCSPRLPPCRTIQATLLILRAALAEIERLQLQTAYLLRNRFGRRSEKLDDEQIERGIEDLEQSEQQAGLDAAQAEIHQPRNHQPQSQRSHRSRRDPNR